VRTQHTLIVDRPLPERREPMTTRRPIGSPWRWEVYLASVTALFTVSQAWAVVVILSTVSLSGTGKVAFVITVIGSTIAIGTGWRTVRRLSRRRR
jgi:hypothetical protein